jgi:hypothetical protein
VTGELVAEIKRDLDECVGYGANKFDRDIQQALDTLGPRQLDMLVLVLSRAILITKRLANEKARLEDEAQEAQFCGLPLVGTVISRGPHGVSVAD